MTSFSGPCVLDLFVYVDCNFLASSQYSYLLYRGLRSSLTLVSKFHTVVVVNGAKLVHILSSRFLTPD
jgi:hypothetical protein